MDRSKMSSVRLTMSREELKTTRDNLKKVKYPVRPISNAMPIDKKINALQPQPKNKLKECILPALNAYRQVRGDGNCFFRAFAFSYIANIGKTQVGTVFPMLDEISLESCHKQTIPKDFVPFYKDGVLKQVLVKYWEEELLFFLRITQTNYKRVLARMLTENHYLDFIIVLYFRALCLYAFTKNKQQFTDFLKGTEEDEIRTYGQESEGVILDLCSKFLQMNIGIYEVRKQDIQTYQYTNLRGSRRDLNSWIHLLFYDSHYDLFEVNPNPLLQYNDEKSEQEFYGDVNSRMVEGNCIECGKKKQVGEDTGLCMDCYNKSMNNLQTFEKDKLITAVCTQCRRRQRDVSEQMGICKECLLTMQYEANPQGYQFRSDVKPSSNGVSKAQNPYHSPYDNNNNIGSYQQSDAKQQENGVKKLSVTGSKFGKGSQSSEFSNGVNISSIEGKYQSKYPQSQSNHVKQQAPSTCKAQLFSRRSEVEHTCSNCRATFTLSQTEPDNILCRECLRKNTKSEVRAPRTVTASGLRPQVAQSTLVSSKNVCNGCQSTFQPHMLTDGFCRQCTKKNNMMRGKIFM